MRVALCLSGLTRNFFDCIDTHKKYFVDPYETDVFIHTWSKSGSNTLPHWYNEGYSVNKHKLNLELQSNSDINAIINGYKPKKILIEYPDIDYFYQKFYTTNAPNYFNTIMMHYSINKSNSLKKEYEENNNFKYGVVIRCRFDSYFINIDMSEVLDDTIYLPPNQNIDLQFTTEMLKLLDKNGPRYMPNDQFAYGSSDAMDYYCSVFDIIKNDCNYYIKHPEGTISEHLWTKNNSKYKNIKINNTIQMKIESRYWRNK
jgi:hypothetical protein